MKQKKLLKWYEWIITISILIIAIIFVESVWPLSSQSIRRNITIEIIKVDTHSYLVSTDGIPFTNNVSYQNYPCYWNFDINSMIIFENQTLAMIVRGNYYSHPVAVGWLVNGQTGDLIDENGNLIVNCKEFTKENLQDLTR